MKTFELQTYYEILDLTPDAHPSEVRDAYRTALEIYQDDSLASYSFFDEDERRTILTRLEEAFLTLIDRERKTEYDDGLVKRGLINKDALNPAARHEPISIDVLKRSGEEIKPVVSKPKNLKTKKIAGDYLKGLLELDVISGEDLREIRVELEISLDHISDETKIRKMYLEALENDEFEKLPSLFHLKSFLRSYLKCFAADVEPFVERYMKRLE